MGGVLYRLIVGPLELLVEVVFEVMFRLLGHNASNQGLAVICVSVTISLLTLPLYRRADKIQREARDKQKQMEPWLMHIRRTFSGDERFMMQQAYYRISGYSPLSVLKGAFPLLLQIPFFMAAYHFLSHLSVLQGASFGLIADLGKPDALLSAGSFAVNVLPILMTLINVTASFIYSRGYPLQTKIQLYGFAAVFLVLLYNSPSGLVLYWTCNNLFSLLKNIFYKLRNPRKWAAVLCAAAGILCPVLLAVSGKLDSRKRIVAVIVAEALSLLPLFLYVSKRKFSFGHARAQKSDGATFLMLGAFLALLLGVLIPSQVIASSPSEFIDASDMRNPLWFLGYSLCYAAGFFLVWASIVRYMLPDAGRHILTLFFWVCSVVFLADWLGFGEKRGTLSPLLSYNDGLSFSRLEMLVNLLVVCALSAAAVLVFRFRRIVTLAVFVLCGSAAVLSVRNMVQIQRGTESAVSNITQGKERSAQHGKTLIHLSRNGKNVIVLMLDRAIGGYVPYMLSEKPELERQFAGFTYFPNTISHGFFTNFGSPALFGGYEYTVTAMNERDTEPLSEKHDEALKMLPVLFGERGWRSTVIDPPYAGGYGWTSDLSVFDGYPNVTALFANGVIDSEIYSAMEKQNLSADERNFFFYSLHRAVPLLLSRIVYDYGRYFASAPTMVLPGFVSEYMVLSQLPYITDVTDDGTNTYLAMQNSATHEPAMLQLPDYTLSKSVDNSGCRTAADGHIGMENELQVSHYHVNMAAFLALGKWFDWMRENGVYDNTRIILVADHGRGLSQFPDLLFDDIGLDAEWCNPLLMVKDFDAGTFSVSDAFMTNADTPSLAVKDIIADPINPFTGKPISSDEKTEHPQLVTSSMNWDTTKNNGTVFDTSDGRWYSVHDDIFVRGNWTMLE